MLGLEEFDDDFIEDNNESKSGDSNPLITALKSLIELKEEVEDDLMCDVDNNYGNWRLNGTKLNQPARCEQKLKSEAKITNTMLHGKGRCTLDVWRCFSTVLEGMAKHVEEPRQIYE